MQRGAFGGYNSFVKPLVFLAVHRAVQVGVRVAAAVTGGGKDLFHIQAFRRYNRRGSIEKAETPPAKLRDFPRKGVGSQRAGCNHRNAVLRNFRHFPAVNMDAGIRSDLLRDRR